jgi:hypothetical protein
MAKDDDRDHEVGRKASEIRRAAELAQRYRKLDYWQPYKKQAEFFAASHHHREVGFFAATQVGKTEAAAILTAYHLTGLYPSWYQGRRFDHATRGWAVAIA